MKIIFIMPSIGRKTGQKYIKTWQMEPLPIAQLSGLTPKNIEKVFYDDRLEEIDYEEKADLIAITVETYTAKRAYQIASEFKKRNIPVILGGFHITLFPDEGLDYADSILLGEAEDLWVEVIKDIKKGKLKKIYESNTKPNLKERFPDRSIFKNKKYLPISLVESGRGCNFNCDFCSITKFYDSSYRPRPVEDIIKEIKTLKNRTIFFIDDNIGANLEHSKKLFQALIPLKIKWVSQISINLIKNDEVLDLMKKSGCLGVLIGFESIEEKNLKYMNKSWNKNILTYETSLKRLNDAGIIVYGTFLFGYDADTKKTLQKTLDFALKNKFFLVAFNHVVPFPGTPLYDRLKKENRLLYDKWWLDESYNFFDIPFKPKYFKPEELANECINLRKQFFSYKNTIKRMETKANCQNIKMMFTFFSLNLLFRKEINQRKGLPLGMSKDEK